MYVVRCFRLTPIHVQHVINVRRMYVKIVIHSVVVMTFLGVRVIPAYTHVIAKLFVPIVQITIFIRVHLWIVAGGFGLVETPIQVKMQRVVVIVIMLRSVARCRNKHSVVEMLRVLWAFVRMEARAQGLEAVL